ncbi:ATP-binding protein [Streptomyces harbinensis]|uniref:ATP-binding protein n=1 Tax=Streptomyces harbinensis TaxID=1176198 RepID=UPI00159214CF|nr:ATP-binding protein [Streptomyces harbinensis]QKV67919.1 ATP-binding protein [Streptomyces harbinensis]
MASVRTAYDQNVFGRTLLADATSIERWRWKVCEVVRDWGGSAGAMDLVRLGVSELLSNVVKHVPDPRCYVRVLLIGGEVTVQVFDRSRKLPVVGEVPDWDAESGRGLRMLREMASGFGCEHTRHGDGKIVWFSCDLVGAFGE